MAAGSEGIGGLAFDDFELARTIGIVALGLILFEGGLATSWDEVRPVIGGALSLARGRDDPHGAADRAGRVRALRPRRCCRGSCWARSSPAPTAPRSSRCCAARRCAAAWRGRSRARPASTTRSPSSSSSASSTGSRTRATAWPTWRCSSSRSSPSASSSASPSASRRRGRCAGSGWPPPGSTRSPPWRPPRWPTAPPTPATARGSSPSSSAGWSWAAPTSRRGGRS